VTFPVTAAADDLRTQRPGGIHERHRAEPDGRKAVSRQELPLPVRTRRGGEVGRRPTPRDDPRRVGRLPTLQRRRDRRGTQEVSARSIITPQPSQVAVTGVVTVRQLSGCQGLESSKQGRNQGTVATRSGSSAAT